MALGWLTPQLEQNLRATIDRFEAVKNEYTRLHGSSAGTQTNVVIKLVKLAESLNHVATLDTEDNRDSFPGRLLEFQLLVGALSTYQNTKKTTPGSMWRQAKPGAQRSLEQAVRSASETGNAAVEQKKASRLRQEWEAKQAADKAARELRDREALAMLTWPNVQRTGRERVQREQREQILANLEKLMKKKPQLLAQKRSLERSLQARIPTRTALEQEYSIAQAQFKNNNSTHAQMQLTMYLGRVQKFDIEDAKIRTELANVSLELKECDEAEQELRDL